MGQRPETYWLDLVTANSAEVLPADGVTIETSLSSRDARGEPTTLVETASGRAKEIADLYNQYVDLLNSSAPDPMHELEGEFARGRGTLKATRIFEVTDAEANEELLQVPVNRPIYFAAYFRTLSVAEVAEVRRAHEDGALDVVSTWAAKQKRLFGHLIQGYDQYEEIYYTLRRTYPATGEDARTIGFATANVVVPASSLSFSQRMQNMIDSLPDGEWLRRPTTIRNLGGMAGFEIREEYTLAPAWSVVYGGTYTGE
jgi:hypothetical protein